MNQIKVYDGKTPYVRIDKRAARIAFDAGKPVIFCPVKLNPFGAWRPSVMMQKGPHWPEFEQAVYYFQYHNCQDHATGYYVAFYIDEAA